jgi:hypothetical protein
MMTILEPAYQALFAVAALVSSVAAIRAAVTHDARAGDYLLSPGSSALAHPVDLSESTLTRRNR